MIIIQEIYSQELWSFIHHGVVTCLVCQKLCTGLFTCPYGAKTIALPACHALGCPVCQAAKATCTAGAQWEKFVIFRFVKQILALTLCQLLYRARVHLYLSELALSNQF